MKIRSGFVSNSSSSSFVIIGKRITEHELDKAKNPIMLGGSEMDEGGSCVHLSKEMLLHIKQNGAPDGTDFWDVLIEEGETGGKISKKSFPDTKEYEIMSTIISYHAPANLQEFIEWFYKENNDED